MSFLSFGEVMLRLKAPGHDRLFQYATLEATFGGGDSLASGLIYGLTQRKNRQDALEFAVA